jgi:hypothetical protein
VAKGLNFRPTPTSFASSKEEIIAEMHGVIDKEAEHFEKVYGKDTMAAWSDAVKETIAKRVRDMNVDEIRRRQVQRSGPQLTPKLLQYINDLKRYFVFTEMDKLHNNVVIICKEKYIDLIKTELDRAEAYEVLDYNDIDELIKKAKADMEALGVPFGPPGRGKKKLTPEDLICLMRITIKFHKSKLAARYISTAQRAVTASLSDLLGRVLRWMMPVLREIWADEMKKVGLPHHIFPIIKSSADVAKLVELYNSTTTVAEREAQPVQNQAWDIVAFYPNVQYPPLFTAVDTLATKVFKKVDPADKKRLNVPILQGKNKGKITLADKDKPVPPGSLGVEVKDLLEWLKVLLKHACVRFGRWLRRQICGIPMGTQCGPDLANVFGLHFELTLLETLVSKVLDTQQPEAVRKEAMEACRALRFYVRFIDDMLNFNNVHFQMIPGQHQVRGGHGDWRKHRVHGHVHLPILGAAAPGEDMPLRQAARNGF